MEIYSHPDIPEILSLPGNSNCCDCNAEKPKWASLNNGVFLCLKCAGIHRSLGSEITLIRSLQIDSWTDNQILYLSKGGNNKFKQNLSEFNIDPNTQIDSKYKSKAADYYRKILKNEVENLQKKLDKIAFENNENVRKVLTEVEKEKAINNNLSLKISEMKKKERQDYIMNEELTKKIIEKESIIKNLTNNNMNLGNNLNELKKDLNIKENEIKKVIDSLIKEKNISKNIAQDLNSEKEKNRKLNDKLDNIANKNNENVSKSLTELDNEK